MFYVNKYSKISNFTIQLRTWIFPTITNNKHFDKKIKEKIPLYKLFVQKFSLSQIVFPLIRIFQMILVKF